MLLRSKILLNSVALSIMAVLVSGLLIGGLSYKKAKQTLVLETQEKLILLRNLKADEIKRYYNTLLNQIDSFAKNFSVIQALIDFNIAYSQYASEVNLTQVQYDRDKLNNFIRSYAQQYAALNGGKIVNASKLLNRETPTAFALQYNYIVNNDYPTDHKEQLLTFEDNTTYSKVHKHYHSLFTKYKEHFGIYDIMLVNAQGVIIYTVDKELDFTTSLVDGVYAKYEIGKIFSQVMQSDNPEIIEISDYIPYIPSYERQASFICVPIFKDNLKIGAIIFQLSIDELDNIMTSDQHWEQIGLGKTGESYLVGDDKTFRSSSRFFLENKAQYLAQLQKEIDQQLFETIKEKDSIIGLQKVDTTAVKQGFLNVDNITQYLNYLNYEVIGSYEELKLFGLNWLIICEISVEEAFTSIHDLANFILLLVLIVILVISWIAVIFAAGVSSYITKRINSFAKVIQSVMLSRDLTFRFNENPKDELKLIASSLNKLFANLQTTFQDTFKSINNIRNSQNENHQSTDGNNVNDNKQTVEQVSVESLDDLTERLNKLSDQFRFFEDQAEKTRDWQ
jgi:methyl-accepting chemotaxis protein